MSHVFLLTAGKIVTVSFIHSLVLSNLGFTHLSLETWAKSYLPFPSCLEMTFFSLLGQVTCYIFCHSYPRLHSFYCKSVNFAFNCLRIICILWYPKILMMVMLIKCILIYLFSSYICSDFPYHLFYSPNILATNSAPPTCGFRSKNFCAKKSEIGQNILHFGKLEEHWSEIRNFSAAT